MVAPLLRRGYTVFDVYHISQPEATVMEIVEEVNRAVRYIRHHARDYGVDPQRLGVTGGSAGGHLSLMLATRGGPGPADAADPIDRESSAVQAVAIFFPVTDLLNLGSSTENLGDGGPPKSFVKAFGPQSTNLAVWKVIGHDVSPIYYVRSNLPPILIYHGDADTAGAAGPVAAVSSCGAKAGQPGGVGHPSWRIAWLVEHDLGHPAIRRLVRPAPAPVTPNGAVARPKRTPQGRNRASTALAADRSPEHGFARWPGLGLKLSRGTCPYETGCVLSSRLQSKRSAIPRAINGL